ncbi:toxin-antitoxin system protein [Enterococcus gallinarum]|uniref:toxin-antitoxin system protein n=1 Tax=Enterococcus gallinarum TaxID=1353 RepID=UPI0014754D90|nr:toxin-antitoxin system protein [Enterococcus gallinarum]NME48489.1 toxin-antitoxin system protein [Enterococcus gallinarum]
MFLECYPWKLDVDIEATKQLYVENNYSIDQAVNTAFMESLTLNQRTFFDSLGVDLMKIEIDPMVYDIPEDEETPATKIHRIMVHFLLKGCFLALPQYQKDIYSDEAVFGNMFPNSIKVLSSAEEDYIKPFHNGIGLGIFFKHPCGHYEDKKFQVWDCGYLMGSILVVRNW